MAEQKKEQTTVRIKKPFLHSLVLANFSTNMMDFLVSVFVVDIALVFLGSTSTSNVGYVSTLLAISNIISFIVGIMGGFLCSRIKYKMLLIIGLLCISIGALGCSFAPNFLALQLFYPLDGVGTVLVGSMAYALAGEHLPSNKKAKALGYIIAGSPISGLVGSFIITLFFDQATGWKSFMLFYVLPISIISLIVVYFNVPSVSHSIKNTTEKQTWRQKLHQEFPSRGVVACLAGNLCRYFGSSWPLFGIAFIRTTFGLSTEFGATIILIGSVGLTLGMILAGHLVNRIGSKRLVTTSVFCLGFSLITYITLVSTGYMWLAVCTWFISGFIGGISYSSNINFTLDQAPKSRGTIMSINSAFIYLGIAVGGAIGGILLSNFNYQVVGAIFAVSLFASFAIFVRVKEPCQAASKP